MVIEGRVRELRDKLDSQGSHLTRQRAAVFNYLSRVHHHPTAEQVFLAVKSEIPRIGLATIYKNLEALVSCGAASKLSFGDAAARYDIRTDQHHHTRCLGCGSINDLEAVVNAALDHVVTPPDGFAVTDYRLELTGYCADCQQQKTNSNNLK